MRAIPPRETRKLTTEKVAFAVILLAFLTLSAIYNFVTPAGEGVDEISHLQYTLYIKDRHALPVLPFTVHADTVLMGYHAPLYYIIAALVSTPLPTDDLNQTIRPNPHFVWVEGIGPGNRNVFLHSPVTGQDPFPWHGVVLTIHLLRFLSTLQGLAALFFIRALARHLLRQPALALAATAATAFQPTFVNTFSLAHNDGMVALFTIVGILWSVRLVAGRPKALAPNNGVVGGAVLGLGLLAKETSFALGPVYALGLGVAAFTSGRWKDAGKSAVVIGVTTAGIAGWWYIRNWLLYGDPLARNLFAALYRTELLQGPYQWGTFIAFLRQLQRNYWGAFGYVHILADPRLGNALWVIAGLAVPGFFLTILQRRHDVTFVKCWGIALAAVIATFALFVQWSTIVGGGAAHGRFFVGVMPVVNAAIVLGLSRYTPRLWPLGSSLFAVLLSVFGFAAPFLYIAPAYRPPLAQPAEIQTATPEAAVFGDQLRLVAAALGPSTVVPGQNRQISLYWSRASAMNADVRYHLRVTARDGSTIFAKDFWPAGGGIPTYTWPEGATYRDTITVPIPTNVAPGWAKLLLSVQTADGHPVPATAVSGSVDEVQIGRLALVKIPTVSALPADAHLVNAIFATADRTDVLRLAAYRIQQTPAHVDLQLFWQATAPIRDDVTVSIQVLDHSGHLVAQNDSEPANGRAPTSTWPTGSIIVDDHRVNLPSTTSTNLYRVVVVVYTRPDLHRLTTNAPSGSADYLPLTDVRDNQ